MESDDPVVVLNGIVKVFGERRSPVQLRDVLQGVRQYHGEQVRLYSHRVKAAFTALTARQKVLGVYMRSLHWWSSSFVDSSAPPYLATSMRNGRPPTFKTSWDSGRSPSAGLVTRCHLWLSLSPQLLLCRQSRFRLDRLERIVGEQWKQLYNLTLSHSTVTAQKKPYRSGYDKSGRRVCYRCKSTEHMVADCPVAPLPGNFQPPQ